MAESYDDEEDGIPVYGATGQRLSQAPVPKIRNLPTDFKSEINSNSAFEEISESTAHSSLGFEDHRELLNPVSEREPEDNSIDSPSKWEDDISITTRTYGDLPCWKHPKVQKNWKVVLGSVLLFITGIILLCVGVGVQIFHSTKIQSFVFFIAGVICLIPGAYHVVYIYCAVKGKKGYRFSQLPSLK